jgi:hypothetical protein
MSNNTELEYRIDTAIQTSLEDNVWSEIWNSVYSYNVSLASFRQIAIEVHRGNLLRDIKRQIRTYELTTNDCSI